MRYEYEFDFLKKIELDIDLQNIELIFFKMFDFILKKKGIYSDNILDFLTYHLNDKDEFFIAHNIIIYKGKKRFFKAKFAVTTKKHLIDFIKYSIDINDLRNFLVSPVFELKENPTYVISIDEEDCISLYY